MAKIKRLAGIPKKYSAKGYCVTIVGFHKDRSSTLFCRIFRLQFPKRVIVIGFADDIAVTIVAAHIKEIVILTNKAIWETRSWLEGADLAFVKCKLERVLITK